jgi:hypothetical protein
MRYEAARHPWKGTTTPSEKQPRKIARPGTRANFPRDLIDLPGGVA